MSFGQSISLLSAGKLICDVGDKTFIKYVLREQIAQVVRQMPLLNFHNSVYGAAVESSLLYIFFIKCLHNLLRKCLDALIYLCRPLM